MYYLTKVFEVPIAHRLSKLLGSRCVNFHGHNIQLEITIKSNILNQNDMIMDFSILRSEVDEIIDSWDHGIFLNKIDANCIEDNCVKHIFEQDPTSEVLCKYLFDKIKEIFAKEYKDVLIHSVAMWETRDSKCVYEE